MYQKKTLKYCDESGTRHGLDRQLNYTYRSVFWSEEPGNVIYSSDNLIEDPDTINKIFQSVLKQWTNFFFFSVNLIRSGNNANLYYT